jgi:iron complex transport system ATP-binding protein
MNLSAAKLSCGYPGRVVLSAVDFSLAQGEFVALIGPNGVGKSTLLRTLTGYLPALGGEVILDRRAVRSFSPRERARRVAYVPQTEPPVFDFTVFDAVLMGRTPYGDEKAAGAKVVAALELLDLTTLAERPVTQISGGELQRALLARALVQECPLMLLDEPTAHLDLGRQAQAMNALRRLVHHGSADGAGVLCVLQDLNLAAEFSDRVVLIHTSGRIHAGAPEEILTEEVLRDTYGPSVHVAENPLTHRPAVYVTGSQAS